MARCTKEVADWIVVSVVFPGGNAMNCQVACPYFVVGIMLPFQEESWQLENFNKLVAHELRQ